MNAEWSISGRMTRDLGPLSDVIGRMERMKRTHAATYFHCVRVALLAEQAAVAMELGDSDRNNLVRGCFVHDLGKLGIPSELLGSDKPLTEDEWLLIKRHPEFGAEMLGSGAELNADIVGIVLHHHERWDGKGYPAGLRGEEIPRLARICAVVDAFDSMTSERPYRARRTESDALRELGRNAGTQFDAEVVERFWSIRNSRPRH